MALFTTLALTSPVCKSEPGPYTPEISAWNDAEKNAQREAGTQLLAKIDMAKLNGDKTFTITKGDYRFSKTSKQGSHRAFIALDNLKNMEIDASGSTFWFEDECWGLHMTNCANVTIKNLNMDWDPLPYTQGLIVGMNEKEKTLDVKIDQAYEKVSKRFASLPPIESDKEATIRGFIFDSERGFLKPCQEGFRVVPFFQTPKVEGAYRIKALIFYGKPLASLNAKVGDKIALLMRNSGGILMEGCGGMKLEDVTQFSCPGLQFVEGACNERNSYIRCKVLPRPGTDRLMGGNADGFHSQNCENGPLIDSCEITSIGDDAVNIHGFYRKVVRQSTPTEIAVESLAWRGKLKDNCTVSFYESSAKGFGLLGEAKIIACRNENGLHLLTLDKELKVEAGALCSIEDYTGPGAIIRNCRFRDIAVRGVLFKSHDAVIEKNFFEWIGSWGIILTTQPGYWGESAMPHDTTIRENQITDVYGKSGIGLINPTSDLSKAQKIRDVSIIGNSITRTAGPDIMLRGVSGVKMTGNTLSGDHTRYSNELGEYLSQTDGAAIGVEGVEDMLDEGNRVLGSGEDGKPRRKIDEEHATKRD